MGSWFLRTMPALMPPNLVLLRSDTAGLRDALDRRGVNRNHCVGRVAVALGVIVGAVYGGMSLLGACYTDATCPDGKEDMIMCNCGKFGLALGGLMVFFGLLVLWVESKSGEGARDVQR